MLTSRVMLHECKCLDHICLTGATSYEAPLHIRPVSKAKLLYSGRQAIANPVAMTGKSACGVYNASAVQQWANTNYDIC